MISFKAEIFVLLLGTVMLQVSSLLPPSSWHVKRWCRQTDTHLSPARHPPSAWQHWALLEEAGKPLIGRLGEQTQQRTAQRRKRGTLYKKVWEEMWLVNVTWVDQDRQEVFNASKVTFSYLHWYLSFQSRDHCCGKSFKSVTQAVFLLILFNLACFS